MTTETAASRLARFVTGLALETVPEPVVRQAGLITLDTLGNALAAVPEDFGRAVLDVAARLGGPALAAGEATGPSGRAVLEAVIAGVEVMCRVGLAVPGALHARHFHPTAVAGAFGAATAGKLHKLDEDRLVHAFGICASQAGGIIEDLADGSWTRRLHPGWATHAGVVAALLAGFTGPATPLEGPHGLFQAFAGGNDAARLGPLLDSLGHRWEGRARAGGRRDRAGRRTALCASTRIARAAAPAPR